MKTFNPKKIFIEKDVIESPMARQILYKLPNVPVEYVDDYRNIQIKGSTINDVYKESKECLAIAKKKGEMVKRFRCRDGIVGNTEYYIIHGNNCCFDCEYCFLQSYLNNEIPTLFVNHEDMLGEIRDIIIASGDKKIVFHAGELSDAFAFDDITGLSRKLITLFTKFPDARLELRTKTTVIENLLDLSRSFSSQQRKMQESNIIISWTFSPQVVIDVYEHKTPSLEERIESAVKVQNAGYYIGICLDPIIRCEDWLNNYKTMIKILFDRLDHTKVRFVSLGGFRFLPSLASVIRERNPQTNILLGEFVPCIDGKYRYFRPIRVEIYRELWKIVRQECNDAKISLCMETHEVWDEVRKVLN